MSRYAGLFIGAGFGMLFVLVNTGPPLASAVAGVLRVLAVLAFAGLVATASWISRFASGSPREPGADPAAGSGELRMDRFGTGYWIVVAAEVVLLFGGFQVLRRLDAPSEANVAWIAVVVGVHFIAFLWVWQQRTILIPGFLLTGYGVAGLIMASTSAVDWVPFVAGVLSGVTLLICCLATIGWEYRIIR
jgi:hypothetical protein